MPPDSQGPLTIRPATAGDVPAILAIVNHAIETTTAVFSYAPQSLAMRQEWFESKRTAGYPVLVADRDGRVAGFATYGPFRAWPAYKYTVEHSVYAAPDVRRQGVGRALLTAIVDDARRSGYRALIAGIVAGNEPSLRLHEALGFVEVAHLRDVGYKFGQWLDLKFLQLLLPGPAQPTDR